jgi:hypothetical protein
MYWRRSARSIRTNAHVTAALYRDEHAFTIGSESLDVEMDKLEKTQHF